MQNVDDARSVVGAMFHRWTIGLQPWPWEATSYVRWCRSLLMTELLGFTYTGLRREVKGIAGFTHTGLRREEESGLRREITVGFGESADGDQWYFVAIGPPSRYALRRTAFAKTPACQP